MFFRKIGGYADHYIVPTRMNFTVFHWLRPHAFAVVLGKASLVNHLLENLVNMVTYAKPT